MDWWTLLAFLFFFCACPLRSVDFRGFILEKTQGLSAVDALCQGHFPPKSRNLVIVIVFSKTAKRFNHNPWFSKFVLQDKVVSLWTWWRQQLLTLIFREISFRPERSCGQQKLPALRLNISAMWQRRREHYRKKANLRMVQNRNSRPFGEAAVSFFCGQDLNLFRTCPFRDSPLPKIFIQPWKCWHRRDYAQNQPWKLLGDKNFRCSQFSQRSQSWNLPGVIELPIFGGSNKAHVW